MVNFNFNNAEYAKYVWKLCVLQHTFYMKYEQNGTFKSPEDISRNLFVNSVEVSIYRNTLVVPRHTSLICFVTTRKSRYHCIIDKCEYSIFNAMFLNLQDYVSSETADSALSKQLGSSVSLNANTQSTSCLDLSVVPEANRARYIKFLNDKKSEMIFLHNFTF